MMKNVLIAATFAFCATGAAAQTELELADADLGNLIEAATSYAVVEEFTTTSGHAGLIVRSDEEGDSLYGKYAVSCDPYLIKVLSTAGSLDDLRGRPDRESGMEEIILGSKENWVADQACEF